MSAATHFIVDRAASYKSITCGAEGAEMAQELLERARRLIRRGRHDFAVLTLAEARAEGWTSPRTGELVSEED